jgi:tRNA (guanine-N7-)-methyltransferase
MSDAHPPLRSYGRLKTRTIKPRQAALMESLLPTLRPPDGPFDPLALMPGAAEAWLEIGFGGGEHMAAQALRRPDVLIRRTLPERRRQRPSPHRRGRAEERPRPRRRRP